MADTKHTPGPWRLDPPSDAHVIGDGYHVISAGDGVEHGRYRGFRVASFISDADACLIAAAPELLAALTQLCFMARTAGGTAGPDPELTRACEGAEALIGKTMGGASCR